MKLEENHCSQIAFLNDKQSSFISQSSVILPFQGDPGPQGPPGSQGPRGNPVSKKSSVMIYLTNRFHVAVRLFSNRSQMTSKSGKNKKVTNEAQPSVSLMFLPDFDVLCDLLLSRRTATWNLFVLYNKELKYTAKKPFYFKFRH